MKRLVLLLAIALTSCTALGLQPDPKVVAFRDAAGKVILRDKQEHPDRAAADDAVLKMGDDAVGSKSGPADAPAIVTAVGEGLLSVPGFTAIGGLLVAAGGLWHTINTRKQGVVTAAAVDQHAALLDVVTGADAADAATTGTAPAKSA